MSDIPFNALKSVIDALDPQTREWEKVRHLLSNREYIDFVTSGTSASEAEVHRAGEDFCSDQVFREKFGQVLTQLEQLENAGDLRFHSVTLYLFVRLLRPLFVVETGVAHGKSSAMILLALGHNASGHLLSIDMVPDGHLEDGSTTRMSGYKTGWLVPEYLRDRWTLEIADSVERLRSMNGDEKFLTSVDFFFHDSLHTYDHLTRELSAVSGILSPTGRIMADNLEMESGEALHDFARTMGARVHSFGNLGFII